MNTQREILFKGKPKNKDEFFVEWLEGDLCHSEMSCYIVYDKDFYYQDNKTRGLDDELISTLFGEVIPETVSQFTGLLDKNGKRIWENSIVKVPDDWDKYGMMAGEIRQIIFLDGGFRFKSINKKQRGFYIEDDGVYEVIGNIFDNSELLEVKP